MSRDTSIVNGMKSRRVKLTGSLACLALSLSSRVLCQSVEEPREIMPHVSDTVFYDDNLYRLPSDHSPYINLLNPGSTPADYINTVTVGLDGLWPLDRQLFDLKVNVASNDYLHNTALDNVSGSAKFVWDWQFGNALSGKLGGDYSRELADFANTLFFSKDLIATTDYFGKAIYELGPHWSVEAFFTHAVTSHSDTVRSGDDYEARSGEFGIDYAMSKTDLLSLTYVYTFADFQQQITFDDLPFNRNYEDNKLALNLKYALGAVTTLDASAGYLNRKYPDAFSGTSPIGAFSGDVWNVAVLWQPTVQSGVKLSGWRDLRANLDAESNYFISRRGAIAPIWSPVEQLNVSLEYARETQQYIASGVTAATVAPRTDRLTTEKFLLVYKPRRILEIDLAYKFEQRDSDEPIFAYKDKLASAEFRLNF